MPGFDGNEALSYVKRRLGIEGLTDPTEQPAELLDYITEGRDKMMEALALSAPEAVRETVTLVEATADDAWKLPDATNDPMRVLRVLDDGRSYEPELQPAGKPGGVGDYWWHTIRELRLTPHATLSGSPEVQVVLHQDALQAGDAGDGSTTATDGWGVPTPTHRLCCKWAVVLALTANEDSDARNAKADFTSELDRIERLYGSYDARSGIGLRSVLMDVYNV